MTTLLSILTHPRRDSSGYTAGYTAMVTWFERRAARPRNAAVRGARS